MRFAALYLAAGTLGLALSPVSSTAQSFNDRDWNTSFRANCPFPVKSGAEKSLSRVTVGGDRKVAFRLRPGDVGGCSTDNKARNHAPYWERAELRQSSTLALGKLHQISFSVHLPEGFAGPRETFFQIHGWAKGCPAYPPVMLQFNGGRLELHSLRKVRQGRNGQGAKGQHTRIAARGASLSQFRAGEQRLTLSLDLRRSPGTVALTINGRPAVAPAPVEFAACAKPHIKFGIYRPGKGRSVSRAIFDDITVKSSR